MSKTISPSGVSHLSNFGVVMARVRKFEKSKDVAEVVPSQAVDLRTAYLNGAVPSDVAAEEAKFNGIEDPSTILGRPADVFDAAAMQGGINDYIASHADKQAED